jgi:glycosyltransferase involved in cell wall biosynthesis
MTPDRGGKHLLMTADAVGGVWVYASSLARELAHRGWRVTLVTLGPPPRQDQIRPLLNLSLIDLVITDLKLEWQDPQGSDRKRVLDFLSLLEARVWPDIVHLNGYREACADWRAPTLVAAHSCVGSWWQACHGGAPTGAEWRPYLADVAASLAAADRWVAPTDAFRETVEYLYAPPRVGTVIWNGLSTDPGSNAESRAPFILAAGRVWDEAKNISVLPHIAGQLDWPLWIAGAHYPDSTATNAGDGVKWLGNLPNADLLGLMRKAGIFVSPALYEPFGLTILEAAASGCALVLADIPSLRELWDGAALFVDPRNADDICDTLNRVCRDDVLRLKLQSAAKIRAGRYKLASKVDAYEQLYLEMMEARIQRTLPPAMLLSEARQ